MASVIFHSYNIITVQGAAASRVFFLLVAEAGRMREKWSDDFHFGLTRPFVSLSAASLIRSIRFMQVESPRALASLQEIEQAMSKGRKTAINFGRHIMNAVGIDISKGKSMVAALRPMGEVAMMPREFPHTKAGLKEMADAITALGDNTRVVMEATGGYHDPVAKALRERGIYVSVVNPLVIKLCGDGSIRKVKTDKADAIRIAGFCLDKWGKLREYSPADLIREQLKLCSRQYDLGMKTMTSLKNNLISLTDKTFPGVNVLFSSPDREDGHQKWVDFTMTFWHCDCISKVSRKAFTERYRKWCRRKDYQFSESKALEIYAASGNLYTTLPKNDTTKLLITTAAQQLLAAKSSLSALRAEMTRLAQQLPEYGTVRAMYGAGKTTAAQLIAEIGDVRRFPRRSSIVAFAGVDPGTDQSGKHAAKSVPTTKRGSPHLRKTLFQVVSTYLKKAPTDEPVYQFLDKKRSEGKPYLVYMTAAQNKFLRIYYARVKECMDALDAQQSSEQEQTADSNSDDIEAPVRLNQAESSGSRTDGTDC